MSHKTLRQLPIKGISLFLALAIPSIPLFCPYPLQAESQLDHLIAPEIKDDAFYAAIYRLAKIENLKTILEIGSSSGEGSTDAFIKGISENPHQPRLFCVEVSKSRYRALQQRYADHPQVTCYNVSSVHVADFPREEEILEFMQSVNTTLRDFGPNEVIRWLRQDIEYLHHTDVPQNGIELIKKDQNIDHFDLVLIDGSEFTGKAELNATYGATWILLDDIRAFKNYENYQKLLNDPQYHLVEEQPYLRNGYAIFKKT